MSKKNKIILIIAILAMLILVGSGIARCTINSNTPEETQQTATEQTAQSFFPAGSSSQNDPAGEEQAFESLVGTSWVGRDDPAQTLTIVSGAFVEGTGENTQVTYWTLDREEVSNDSITASLSTSNGATNEAISTIAFVEVQDDGTQVLTCDALSQVYVSAPAPEQELAFANVTSNLAESMDADANTIEQAVRERVSAISPNARTASWDAEVWIDFKTGTSTTSFTLDDGASTIISVTRQPDGTVEAI